MKQDDLLDRIRRLLPRVASPLAFLFALALVGAAIVLRFPLDAFAARPLPPFITLYPAIVIASFIGGVRVGFFAALLSGVAAWFLWLAPLGPITPSFAQAATALIYAIAASITILFSGAARLLLDEVAAAEQLRARAAQESVHRIKNLLAVIQSISRKIADGAEDVGAYRKLLDARLMSLATAQDILLKHNGGDIPLKDLVTSTLGPFMPEPRFELRVEAPIIVPKQATTHLSMALYELATNALKYGALANSEGFIRLESGIAEQRCFLEWREIGLAHVAVGESAGLGSMLIRSALERIEGGFVRYDISPQAVSCTFDWPHREP